MNYNLNSIIEYGICFIGLIIFVMTIMLGYYKYYLRLKKFLQLNKQLIPPFYSINNTQVINFAKACLEKLNNQGINTYNNKIDFDLLASKKFNNLKTSFYIEYFSVALCFIVMLIVFMLGPKFHTVLVLIMEMILITILVLINLPILKTMYYCSVIAKKYFKN